MDSAISAPRRRTLPIAVHPGNVGLPINILYLTIPRQEKLATLYLQEITEAQASKGAPYSESVLEFECDFALAQLRAAARLRLSSSPDRRRELSDLIVSNEHFQGSYGLHWEDVVHAVSPFIPCSRTSCIHLSTGHNDSRNA
jgi:hypothetical protein